ncbi:MAG TPA: hypothetical protein VFO69_10350 [Allosphingosinicella sp.]|nr:hypothetical protein [Allosphingosinicella sp.]
MPAAFYFREQARLCREHAANADSVTAEQLLFLAEEYEAEADRMDLEAPHERTDTG